MIGHYNGFGFDFELPGLTGPGRLSLTVGAPATGTSVEIGGTATSVAPQTVDAGFNLSARIPNFRPPSVRLPGRVYTQTGAPGAADPNAGRAAADPAAFVASLSSESIGALLGAASTGSDYGGMLAFLDGTTRRSDLTGLQIVAMQDFLLAEAQKRGLVGPSTPPVEKKSNMMLYAGAGVAAIALLLLLRRK